jgi:hypothetical protein
VKTSWHLAVENRRVFRLALVGIGLALAALLAVTAQLLRAAEPLKVAGLPVT